MKTIKNIIIMIVLVLSLGLISCSNSVQDDLESYISDHVQDNLINYINVELTKIYDLDDRLESTYESVSGDNYVDDYANYTEVSNNVVPLSLELIDKLENISPETEEFRVLNEKLIEN